MARKLQIYNSGWVTIPETAGKIQVYHGSGWFDIAKVQEYDGSAWHTVWEASGTTPPPTCPAEGVHVLSPTSSTVSYAVFDTSAYQGCVTAVKARISWGEWGSVSLKVKGRTSETYYRSIVGDTQWANRTIDHDLYSTAASQFNSGSATGYTLYDNPNINSTNIKGLKLVIVV